VLYDAYLLGEPNREIMSKLYISEGTFNRTRRRAIRALAKALLEMEREASEEIS
jgi:DNA-directed RNA polymerase specialized sigma24 family protein